MQYAAEHGFDPLNGKSWSSYHLSQITDAKVFLFLIFLCNMNLININTERDESSLSSQQQLGPSFDRPVS